MRSELAALQDDLTEMALAACWLALLVEWELAQVEPPGDRPGPPQYALAA